MSPDQEPSSSESYWQHDRVLGTVTYYGKQTHVHIKAHLSTERFFEPADINWLNQSQGERTYIFMRPYLAIPSTLPTTQRTPEPSSDSDLDDLFGSDLDTSPRTMERAIGTASAAYYPAVHSLLVWEFDLTPPFRPVDPAQDVTYQALWRGMEHTLLTLLPETRFLVTPGWDPQYDQDTWERFLVAVDYLPHLMHQQLFMKSAQEDHLDPTRQRP
jgi:hypothetical protein